MDKHRIAVVGGSGALGGGLALRCARAGYPLAIGSRDAERARNIAREVRQATGAQDVIGCDNFEAAAFADIVFVTVPFASQSATLASIKQAVEGKIVVDTTVPLVPPKVARVTLPSRGSAAGIASDILGPSVRLVTAFHNVSAHKLRQQEELGCDVLVFGDDVEARDTVVELSASIGARALHAGPLANSIAAEAMTSVLISINKRYKVAEGAGIRIVGVEQE